MQGLCVQKWLDIFLCTSARMIIYNCIRADFTTISSGLIHFLSTFLCYTCSSFPVNEGACPFLIRCTPLSASVKLISLQNVVDCSLVGHDICKNLLVFLSCSKWFCWATWLWVEQLWSFRTVGIGCSGSLLDALSLMNLYIFLIVLILLCVSSLHYAFRASYAVFTRH